MKVHPWLDEMLKIVQEVNDITCQQVEKIQIKTDDLKQVEIRSQENLTQVTSWMTQLNEHSPP